MLLFYAKDFLLLFGILFLADGIASMIRNAKALRMEKTR
jgi:hypothetical protein